MMSSSAGCTLGIIGLGLLNRNLTLTIAGSAVPVACYDPDPRRIRQFGEQVRGLPVTLCGTIEEFTGQLRPPRAMLVLMQGGPDVEELFQELGSHLDAGDLMIDVASYHHLFTPRRRAFFAGHGIHFVAAGIASSGHRHQYGCRSLYPELQEICRLIRPLFETAAARAADEPCVLFVCRQIEQKLRRLETGHHPFSPA